MQSPATQPMETKPEPPTHLPCSAKHNNSQRMMVCLKPSCVSKCLICPMCAEYEHNGPLHFVQHIDQFRDQSLKTLSCNSGNPDLVFLEALKKSKGNIIQRIKQIQISLSNFVKKLRYAVNNQFQILIQSYDPQTYPREQASFLEGLNEMKIINAAYRIQLLKQNEFQGKIENVLKAEEKNIELFEEFFDGFATLAGALEKKNRYVADLRFSDNLGRRRMAGAKLFERQNINESSTAPKVEKMDQEAKLPNLAQVKKMISIDSESDSGSERSRSRDKNKKQPDKKVSEQRKSNKPSRKEDRISSNIQEKRATVMVWKKISASQECQPGEKKSASMAAREEPAKQPPLMPFIVESRLKQKESEKQPEPKANEKKASDKISPKSDNGSAKEDHLIQKKLQFPKRAHEVSDSVIKEKTMNKPMPATNLNSTTNATKPPKLPQKPISSAPQATTQTPTPKPSYQKPTDPRPRKPPTPSSSTPQPPQPPQPANNPNKGRPPRHPHEMTDQELQDWFHEEYKDQSVLSFVLSHRYKRPENMNEYYFYFEGVFQWKSSEFLRFVDEGPRIDSYRESLKYYSK